MAHDTLQHKSIRLLYSFKFLRGMRGSCRSFRKISVNTIFALFGKKFTERAGSIITRSAGETFEFGKRLGETLGEGDLLALSGPLGAGKTVIAKGIGRGLDVEEEILSPSFNIVLVYKGRLTYRHVDFYRLKAGREAADIGMEEYLEGDGVTVVEWADRFPEWLPEERLSIDISFLKGDERRVELKPAGRRFKKLVENIMRRK